jgi:hypothetical protein
LLPVQINHQQLTTPPTNKGTKTMNTTYTVKELWAQKMADRPGCWFTAAGSGFRLYVGTPNALSSQGFFATWDELFAAASLKGK